jgi:poly-gamma-glutamate synthesis protein (capsule biosynthesis protein)
VPEEQVRFAHRLLDGGVDVVHGHSSHHPRPLEVYDGRLVLYGCGDLVNDYEGIAGEGARYRDDLRVLYVVDLSGPPPGATTGWSVRDVRLVVLQSRRLRLELAEAADVTWLADRLTSASQRFGVRLEVVDDAILAAAHR